jgi:dienelactone hydrolase
MMSFSRRDFLLQLGLGGAALMLSGTGGSAQTGTGGAAAPPASQWDPTQGGPHLGNLWEFIQQASDRLPRSLAFEHARLPLAEWKQRGRAKVTELLSYQPPAVDLNLSVRRSRQCNGYTEQRVFFNTAPDVRIPGVLLVPDDKRHFPAPGVVALHDHGAMYRWGHEKICENEAEHPVLKQFKIDSYEGQSHASELARRGYVVLVIDAFYFGERRLAFKPLAVQSANPDETEEEIKAFIKTAAETEALVAKTMFWGGMTWPGVLAWDDMRSVDALQSLDFVDKDRIGCVGLSIGGYRSAHLAALDERVKCAVVAGWMSAAGPMLRNFLINHTWMVYIPGMLNFLDLPDIMSLHCPMALRIIGGELDTLFPLPAVKEAFAKIASVYEANGVGERFQGVIYPNRPHEFNKQMQAEAFAFMDKYLQPQGAA